MLCFLGIPSTPITIAIRVSIRDRIAIRSPATAHWHTAPIRLGLAQLLQSIFRDLPDLRYFIILEHPHGFLRVRILHRVFIFVVHDGHDVELGQRLILRKCQGYLIVW